VSAALAMAAAAAGAQAPHITPAGDPSIRSDTMYALAVKPGEHADEPYVVLFDDGVIRMEPDGRATTTYRQIVQILTPEAAAEWGQRTFAYSAGREKLTINWMKVVKPDGEVVSAKPTHEQESLAPVSLDAPVYSDEKIHTVTLGGVAPGTIIDYSVTTETLKPIIPDDFFTSWSVQNAVYTRRSRYLVDVPASMTPRIIERHLPFARTETESHGRRLYSWITSEIPKPQPEPLAPDSAYGETIEVATPRTWADIARWYAQLSRDRYALTPAIEQKVAEEVKGATTLADSLRDVQRWVAQDFRYVSLSLGIGGYQPHEPASMFQNKYGDCKDKATFFIAVLRHWGLTAYPVLLSADGGVDEAVPSAHQFDHMIAAVARPAGGYTFVDLTADLAPYGELMPGEQGEFGLVVHPDGTGEEVTFPVDSASQNLSEVDLDGTIAPDGSFAGKWTRLATGLEQFGLRNSMSSSTKLDSTQRARATLALANAIIDGATGDSLQLFDGRDLRAVPRISVQLHGGTLVNDAGGTRILTLPIRNFAAPNLVASLEARGPRTLPIDAAKVVGLHVDRVDLQLTLPPGWHARLPTDVHASSVFGTYDATYSQTGKVLHVTRSLTGTRGVQPASAMPTLIAWLKAMSADDVKYIVMEGQ
jgi:transglutaminase-like putative cysteine protease